MGDIGRLPRIAAIATMPSRQEGLKTVLAAIRAQVEHVFVYLDGYAQVPDFLKGLGGVSVFHAEEVGDMHSASRLLCLRNLTQPTVVALVDDDIHYPPNYVERLVEGLQLLDGGAVVGVHGRIFLPPHQSYVHHAVALHLSEGLPQARYVHEVGAGTCAFISERFPVDPTAWDNFDSSDISLAIEAQKRGLPRIAIARHAGWLRDIGKPQSDSLWARKQKDDSQPTRQMLTLLGLYS
jgi:hypothetical protein